MATILKGMITYLFRYLMRWSVERMRKGGGGSHLKVKFQSVVFIQMYTYYKGAAKLTPYFQM